MQSKDPNHKIDRVSIAIIALVVIVILYVQESDFRHAEAWVRQYCQSLKLGYHPDYLNKYNHWCKEQEK